MTARLLASVLLVVSVISCGILARFATIRLCTSVIECIEEELRSVEKEDKPAGTLSRGEELWKEKRTLLSIYITHERLNEVDQGFERAVAFSKAYNREEYYSALMELRFGVALVRDLDSPSIRNIF